MTDLIFANNFWGLKDEGFQVLTSKMNSNKKTLDEIKAFYGMRASLHEEFGRKLMKFTKSGIGREETGTLYALLSSAHKETEWTAQAHLNLAHILKTRLEVDLDNFILEQKDKRKLTHANIEKVHRYKISSEAYLAKVKEKYESDCAKLYTLQAQLPNTTGRETDRMRQKMERTQHEINIQEQEYRNACVKLADTTDQWNKAWKMTCDTYQGMDKKRLEFLHHSFSMYINVLSTASSQDLESSERFWKALDNYNTEQDIQTFIIEKGTGPKIPEPELFVDYLDDPSKNDNNYTMANFDVPQEFTKSQDPTPSHKEMLQKNELSDNPSHLPSNTMFNYEANQPDVNYCEYSQSLKLEKEPKKQASHHNNTCSSSNSEWSQFSSSHRAKPTVVSHTYSSLDSEPRMPAVTERIPHKESCKPAIVEHTPCSSSRSSRKAVVNRTSLYMNDGPISERLRRPKQEPVINEPKKSSDQSITAGDSHSQKKSEYQRKPADENKASYETRKPISARYHEEDTNSRRSVASQNTLDTLAYASSVVSSASSSTGEEDVEIDPRAKVVFSIGNNMFDLGQLGQETKPARARRSMLRQRPDPEPMNFSYKSLLEELGIVESLKPLFWARTTQANHRGRANELKYSQGTRLAILEKSAREGWFMAAKYDERTRQWTQEKGLVSSQCIQQE
ncbi:hypothetical protein BY458DRAFT_512898 [Sporodiniella umbellata]|nr:hypothetical protein BY458DRAFT_512898 [Sporodiniella umbellata]